MVKRTFIERILSCDRGALPCQKNRRSFANSASTACDQGDFAFQGERRGGHGAEELFGVSLTRARDLVYSFSRSVHGRQTRRVARHSTKTGRERERLGAARSVFVKSNMLRDLLQNIILIIYHERIELIRGRGTYPRVAAAATRNLANEALAILPELISLLGRQLRPSIRRGSSFQS
jgi:hypothetical protein